MGLVRALMQHSAEVGDRLVVDQQQKESPGESPRCVEFASEPEQAVKLVHVMTRGPGRSTRLELVSFSYSPWLHASMQE